MAVFTRVNGKALAGEFFGRDLVFVKVALANIHVNFDTVNSDFEKTVRTLQTFGTISVVGTPAAGVAMFVMEGLSNQGTSPPARVATATVKAAVDAATSGTSTITFTDGLAASF